MQPIFRTATRAPRARFFQPRSHQLVQGQRLASTSYGNEQSGQEQGTDIPNPKAHMEHPGPESPASKGSGKSKQPSSGQSNSGESQSSSSNHESTSHGGSPAIHNPKSAAESEDPEVKKHNDEMRNRSDRSVNQLSEEDNKVNKSFWKGDVGNTKKPENNE